MQNRKRKRRDNSRMEQIIVPLSDVAVRLECKHCKAALSFPLLKMTSAAIQGIGVCPLCRDGNGDSRRWTPFVEQGELTFGQVAAKAIDSVNQLLRRIDSDSLGFTIALEVGETPTRGIAPKESSK
jgi:hypothetical protein